MLQLIWVGDDGEDFSKPRTVLGGYKGIACRLTGLHEIWNCRGPCPESSSTPLYHAPSEHH